MKTISVIQLLLWDYLKAYREVSRTMGAFGLSWNRLQLKTEGEEKQQIIQGGMPAWFHQSIVLKSWEEYLLLNISDQKELHIIRWQAESTPCKGFCSLRFQWLQLGLCCFRGLFAWWKMVDTRTPYTYSSSTLGCPLFQLKEGLLSQRGSIILSENRRVDGSLDLLLLLFFLPEDIHYPRKVWCHSLHAAGIIDIKKATNEIWIKLIEGGF